MKRLRGKRVSSADSVLRPDNAGCCPLHQAGNAAAWEVILSGPFLHKPSWNCPVRAALRTSSHFPADNSSSDLTAHGFSLPRESTHSCKHKCVGVLRPRAGSFLASLTPPNPSRSPRTGPSGWVGKRKEIIKFYVTRVFPPGIPRVPRLCPASQCQQPLRCLAARRQAEKYKQSECVWVS